jgi:type II secretory pathway pseudopilin PulG
MLKKTAILSKKTLGFTFIEIIVCVGILATLSTLIFYVYPPILNKAQTILCVSRMKSIHAALSTNLVDKQSWPQPPGDLEETQLQAWWVTELTPYGINKKTWMCPTITQIQGMKEISTNYRSSYSVTSFEKTPSAPYKWALQPWLIEVAGLHSEGPHICFPDGAVQNMNNLIKKAK